MRELADEFQLADQVEILNTVPSEIAVEPLIKALDDKDWWVHERAIDALAKSGDARAVEPLLGLMNRESRAIPLCLKALGQLGDRRAVEPVCRMATSESPDVKREALHALTLLVKAELPEEERALVQRTLESAGVNIERVGLRPMEMRRRRPDSGSTATQDSGERPTTPVPASEGTSTPATPRAGTPRPLNYQELPHGTRLLDRYLVVRRIGGGGFGAVYLVEDVIVREQLVLKVLSPHLSMDEGMIRRFVQELKYTRRITHSNVIRIYDLINLDGAHAISMEYFPSQDLGRILRDRGPLPLPLALRISAQVCDGLQAAHDKNVVHRDIKPGNILVGADDETKIVDFGLASVSTGSGSRLTKSGILVGTPEYISPEQITGGEVDGRTDLYSFGVVMYEMLTGHQPFAGDNAVNMLFMHLDSDVPQIRSLAPHVPEALERVVMRALAKDPKDRPASALEMLAMIRSAA